MKKNTKYRIVDWNAKHSWVLPSIIAIFALIVELLIINADYLGWYVHTQEKAESINGLFEAICLGYLSGYLIYVLTVFLPNYIKLYRYKKYVVEDLGDLRNGVRLVIDSIIGNDTDESIENAFTFYQSIKIAKDNNVFLLENGKELRNIAYLKIGNALNNLNDKRDLFSLEELELIYKLKPRLLSIDKTINSLLNCDLDKDKILVSNMCKSLHENYTMLDNLYNRIKKKYWFKEYK